MSINSLKNVLLILCMTGVVWAQSTTWAVLASGLNRDPDENRDKSQAVLRMSRFLRQEAEITNDHLLICVDANSFAASDNTRPCNQASLQKVLQTLSQTVQPQDTFIFYYVGQANRIKDTLRLNVAGPDICHDTLTKNIKAIKAKKKLIILDCPCAGLLIAPLAEPNQVIIAAAGSDQPFSTRFSQYFIPALTDPNSDSNDDNRISLLEAFSAAVEKIDTFYAERDLVATENPLLEDDADGIPSQRPWTFATSGKDGKIADQWFLIKDSDTWTDETF